MEPITPLPEVPEESDHELIRRAQKGRAEAMSALYKRYQRKVYKYLYHFTGNRSTAEELTQETFVRVIEHLPGYRPTGSVGGWIYRIAGNLGLNALRDRPSVREISLDEPVELAEGSVDRKDALAGWGPRPDEEAASRERKGLVRRSLLKVSPPYRSVLILCDIEGYPYQEAAEMLGLPINTVASRLSRGREQLAKLLGFLKKEGI
ncbi:MAG: sigma-70 family RNA polymerase sigma factor [Candidatus Omnitrophica bacterium]|nr:sigma-70 family RNA polymerase sigma factor [Candidatus Omnitrophota bacterium]